MSIISSDHKMKYNFSEIFYQVHGYWKWFAEINDSTPLLMLNMMQGYPLLIIYAFLASLINKLIKQIIN